MKPTDRVLEVSSTLAGESVRMGIDESALQHIISVLTDLYSDPEMAVIREYSTNALDAHTESGDSRPIEVTLPSPLAPFFRVKDYGYGLDIEDIRATYSRYGTSTKRDSNDVVGMLGLGCKSALTYCDQFTLVGTKDGRTVQVSISRDEDGGGSMTIVSDESTPDAASGVEVVVPAKRGNDFDEKAADFFRFWTPGTVLVNGAEPAYIGLDPALTWLEPGKLAVLATERRYDAPAGWVVMGNVAYPMPGEGYSSRQPYSIVAFVDIGDVSFTPSREALQLTKRTTAKLESIRADVKATLLAAMQSKVTQAPTPHAAIQAAQTAGLTGVKLTDLTYKGKPIPANLERGGRGANVGNSVRTTGTTSNPGHFLVADLNSLHARKSGESRSQIPAFAQGRVYFHSHTAQEFSSAKREKLEAWMQTPEGKQHFPDGTAIAQIVLVEKFYPDELFWMEGTKVLDWTPIQAIKLARATTVGSGYRARPTGSYELSGGGHIEAANIDTTAPICWMRTNERYHERYDSRINRWSLLDSGLLLVVLPVNRRAKFERDFPTALHWLEYVKKEATDWLAAQDPAHVEAAKYQISGQGGDVAKLDPARVDDPELVKWIKLQNVPTNVAKLGIEKRAELLGLSRYDLQSKYPNPLAKYPLGVSASHPEHTYLYLNAAYAAEGSAAA